MTSYTPEQIRQCVSWLAGNFRVTADGKYRECADILAATLKAAQGGVTEAGYVFVCSNPACRAVHIRDPRGFCPACVAENGSGWSTTRQRLYRDGPERYSTEEEGEAFMDGWYDGQAALSAQQGQGEALLARVCGMVPGMSRVTLQLPSGPLPEWADLGCTVSVGEPTAPPAQPAERVPEGWVLVPASPTDEMVDAGSSEWRNQNIFRMWDAMLAASPAPSPAERAPEVPRRKASDYASGTYGPDDLAAIWNCCCEAHKRASPAPSPARGDGGEG